MHKLILFSLFSFLTFSQFSYAEEVTLSITDNDDNNEVYNLVVLVDDNTQSLKRLYKDTYINGQKISRTELDALDLQKDHGVILEKRGVYNVLNLKSDNFEVTQKKMTTRRICKSDLPRDVYEEYSREITFKTLQVMKRGEKPKRRSRSRS